jgi:hypothetical protein
MSCRPECGCLFEDGTGIGVLDDMSVVKLASKSGFTSTPGVVGNGDDVSVVVQLLVLAFGSSGLIMPFS